MALFYPLRFQNESLSGSKNLLSLTLPKNSFLRLCAFSVCCFFLQKQEEDYLRRQRIALLNEVIDVEDVIVQLLVTESYDSVDSIATASFENLEKIEGLDSDLSDL